MITDNNGVPESVIVGFSNRIGNAILLASGDDVCIFKAFNTDPVSGMSGVLHIHSFVRCQPVQHVFYQEMN